MKIGSVTDEYNEHHANLCNSKARFMQWGQLDVDPGYNSIPPMFKPPLQYNSNGSDKNFAELFRPGTISNSKRNTFPLPTDSTNNMNGKINRPGHVVISDYTAHHAAEACGSQNSRETSFVSIQDGMYCDMSTKTAHPLCSLMSNTAASGCFDLDPKRLITQTHRHAKDLKAKKALKRYRTHERWNPTS